MAVDDLRRALRVSFDAARHQACVRVRGPVQGKEERRYTAAVDGDGNSSGARPAKSASVDRIQFLQRMGRIDVPGAGHIHDLRGQEHAGVLTRAVVVQRRRRLARGTQFRGGFLVVGK